jgi:tellurite resistance protein
MDTLSDLRVESICAEFDARLEQVGVAMARLELAKALAENEKTIVELAELKMDYAIKGGEMLVEITQLRSSLDEARKVIAEAYNLAWSEGNYPAHSLNLISISTGDYLASHPKDGVK